MPPLLLIQDTLIWVSTTVISWQNMWMMWAEVMSWAVGWPDWYQYKHDSLTGDILFGTRILLCSNIVQDHKKVTQWVDTLLMLDKDILLHRLFNFQPISSSNRSQNLVSSSDLEVIWKTCNRLTFLPPTMGALKRFSLSLPVCSNRLSKRKR